MGLVSQVLVDSLDLRGSRSASLTAKRNGEDLVNKPEVGKVMYVFLLTRVMYINKK